MIPARFDYARAESAPAAVELLAHAGGTARLIAGGQSLLPLLKARALQVTQLVDIDRATDLEHVEITEDSVRIGAGKRLADLAHDAGLGAACPVLQGIAGGVADPQVRHRATIGGWLAHADPRYDIGAVLLALGAEVTVLGPSGSRTLPVHDLFVGRLSTGLDFAELITEIVIPRPGPSGAAYRTFRRRAVDSAIAGVAASVRLDDGVVVAARVGLTNLAPTPVRARAAEQTLIGERLTVDLVAAAARAVIADCDPADDVQASAGYRTDLARTLASRCLRDLLPDCA